MPSYIVSCKESADESQVAAVKKQAVEQGGTITHEFALLKGFSVKFPEGHISTLAQHEHVKAVEADGEVRTQ